MPQHIVIPATSLVEFLSVAVTRYGSIRRAADGFGVSYSTSRDRLAFVQVTGDVDLYRLAPGGPAERAGILPGDTIVAVGDERISGLADLLRHVWRLGPAGTTIPLLLARNGAPTRIGVRSADRSDFLKKPSLQ